MSSLVVFSPYVGRLVVFYETVLGATPLNERSGDIRLLDGRDEVLVHSIPQQVARSIEVTSPPAPRENSPLKPVLDVDSFAVALASVESTGGVVTSQAFSLHGLTRHNILDSDGNVIQLRCRIP
jgi:predicted enzyme related to lactoylglutathione lyase